MIEILSGGKFRSSHGFATESLQRSGLPERWILVRPDLVAEYHAADGWVGCEEMELVRDTVLRFANKVSTSGFAENIDIVTGEGLRDWFYTWTVRAFLIMCHEFL